MKHFITCLFIVLVACSFLPAQPTWTMYLGADMNLLYHTEYCSIKQENGFSFFQFYGADRFSHHSEPTDNSYEENRAGVLLTPKNTQQRMAKEEIVFGKDGDSVKIIFQSRTEIVTHGRSAALSVLNLFSKKEDKIKQEDPYDEVTYREMKGIIMYGNDSYGFLCGDGVKNKNTVQWLVMGADTLKMIPARLFQKSTNGKIKNRSNLNEGWQLMKGDTCMAALDKNDRPMTLYLWKSASEKERLIITAFFLLRRLKKLQ